MMIEGIKNRIINNKDVLNKFVFFGARNQSYSFVGKIKDIYPAIFTVIDEYNKLRSFSYSDVLIGKLKIIPKK